MTANYEYSCSNRENLPNLTFSQLVLLWEIKILFWDTEIVFPVSLSCLHLKAVSQSCFTSFVHPMQSKALQPSFHRALAFLQWHFVLVVKYQVNFCKAETSHLKSILSNHTAKLCFICNVMRFAKIQPCSQRCYLIDFVLFLFG